MKNRIAARSQHALYRVLVDGVEIPTAYWVDVKRGRVLSHRQPYVIRNNCLARSFTQGKVELVPL